MGVLHICDDDGTELSAGEIGTIYFERDVAPFEYHNDPEKTAASRHPAHDNWCTVGDVGYLDEDGYLFLTDRKGFMIISGGVNIYPQEVENVLALHPKILDVAVIGVPDAEMGEQVKAVVQLRDGVTPSDELAAEIIAYVRDRIAHYKAPKSVDFVNELPRSATGKLVKRVLIDRYAQRKHTMSEFANKRYVVTGAASGIGHAVAEKLLAAGAEVYSLDRNSPDGCGHPPHRSRPVESAQHRRRRRATRGRVRRLDERGRGSRHRTRGCGAGGQCPGGAAVVGSDVRPAQARRHRDDRVVDGGLRLAGAARRDRRTCWRRTPSRRGRRGSRRNPQQGNAYNFSKEVTTVYAMSMALMAAQQRVSHQRCAAGAGGDADPGRLRGHHGQGHPRRPEGLARSPRHS